ncbi:MAG: glycine cleavage system protein H [Candidatus Heimdallarchaeota archaeon]|nr:glycine cleavage system protein H [Candidatus Heimdallarchaeota archaeon]MCK4954499.1 glycine cleavage system protein H [Candidatus Heimdallarchaeota archaeon]
MIVNEYNFPDDLFYYIREPGHIWIRRKTDNTIEIGIDDYASKRAGEIEFIRTMQIGKRVKKDQIIGTIESGKWIGQIKSPITGIIVEKNEDLRSEPSIINEDPYGKGWILTIEGKDFDIQIEDDDEIIETGEKLEEYIKWRISQE